MYVIRVLPFLVAAFVLGRANLVYGQSQQSVVVAPISSLAKTSPKKLAAIEKVIEVGLLSLANTKVISAKEAALQSRKAKRPELRSCEGNAQCIRALGELVKADYVVYGELGGLGKTEVMYLKLINVKDGKELRSTTLNLSLANGKKLASKAAATRLLAPNQYVGSLAIESSIPGAVIFLDGHKIGVAPSKTLAVFVGSHALRITHPEASDFVRFVDIAFQKKTAIKATLLSLPGVNQDLTREGILGNPSSNTKTVVKHKSTPWYLRWYTITGGVLAIGVTSAILFRSDGIDPDLIIEL